MSSVNLEKASKLNIERNKKKKLYRRVVSVLAAIVVFCTTYALILPAITMNKKYSCGLEEHTHGDTCFTEYVTMTLTCSPSCHTHTEDCKDENGDIICGYSDFLIHTHNEFCYDVSGEMICTLPEIYEHIHDSGCYSITENDDDSGKGEPTSLVSENGEEYAAVLECPADAVAFHLHGDACFGDSGSIICSMPETNKHLHSEECVEIIKERVLICTLPQHIHDSALCKEEEVSSAETPSQWEATLPTERTGELSSDLLAVAKSQLGYLESTSDTVSDADGEMHGYTRYGDFSGNAYMKWNIPFINFCMHYTDSKAFSDLYASDCNEMKLLWEKHGIFADAAVYTGMPGDLVFIDSDKDGISDTAAILSGYSGELPRVISGDKDNAVREFTVEDLTVILGYGKTGKIPSGGSSLSEEDTADGSEDGNTDIKDPESFCENPEDTSSFDRLEEEGFYTYWEQFTDKDAPALLSETAAPMTLRSTYNGSACTAYAYKTYLASEGDNAASSESQISYHGGSNVSEDGLVTVSKTIEGTELENVFDITLTVDSQENLAVFTQDPDMSIVIVMDISNTMRSAYGDMSRYEAAVLSAEHFIDKFEENAPENTNASLGFVAFNTSAHEIFALQDCTTPSQATALKNEMRQDTGTIINASGYDSAHTRFTNVEAGLAMAYDMLNTVDSLNKYIIFLSDGFPTTYMKDGTTTYEGYDPYCSSGTPGKNGVFYDSVFGVHCDYGTSYSDKSAIRAREKADEIKESGTKIFSIGVDVAGQNIQYYIDSSSGKSFSVVDRTGTTYEIGVPDSTESYKNWLRDSIGSGYYYDSSNSEELEAAFQEIFDEIKRLVISNTVTIWAAIDPMPIHVDENIYVEFIHFYDINSAPQPYLSGEYKENAENTAVLNDEEHVTIHWDLKTSGYTSSVVDNTTHYYHTLKYRVRLENEDGGFEEDHIYNTNNPTTLTYQNVTITNGKPQYSESKTVDFPIPSVYGYESELSFKKTDHDRTDMSGVTFSLTHDTGKCSICHGDGTATPLETYTAVSDENGNVSFNNIPSGHIYSLSEDIPENYKTNGDKYSVQIEYNELTISIIHPDGTVEHPEDNTFTVVNTPEYIPDDEALVVKKALYMSDSSPVSNLVLASTVFRFRVVKADSDGIATDELFLPPGTEFTLIENDAVIGTSYIASDGTFTLKANQSALFSDIALSGDGNFYCVQEIISSEEKDNYVSIDLLLNGKLKTPESKNTDSDTVYSSSAADKYELSSIVFRNTLDESNFGEINVTKKLGSSGFSSDEYFLMRVTLGGAPLPIGTLYTVGGEERYVESPGIVRIKADETAVISGIPAGTPFEVTEVFSYDSISDTTLSNVALNKSATAKMEDNNAPVSRVTDGVKNDTSLHWDGGAGPSWFIIDLEGKYNISYFKAYGYWKDGRSYMYNIYTSLDGVNYTLVADTAYLEATSSGAVIDIESDVQARYIKVEIERNTVNVYTHCVEFEAYGYLLDESTYNAKYDAVSDDSSARLDITSNGVSGEITSNGNTLVTVTNTKYPFSVTIPVNKTALHNSSPVTFSFSAQQVANGTWEVISDLNGTFITTENSENASGSISVGFEAGTTGTYYYKIFEIVGNDSFLYDDTFYIVKVTAAGNFAYISAVYKNGTEEVTSADISFVNTLVSEITVTKEVEAYDTDGSFSFTLTVSVDGEEADLSRVPESDDYTVDGNVITFSLSHGEYVNIKNLPYNANVSLTEDSGDEALTPYYRVGSQGGEYTRGDTVILSLQGGSESIHFKNKAHYELPETGDHGIGIFMLPGILLMLLAAFILFTRRKRELA